MLLNKFQTKEKGPCYLFQYCGSLQAVLCRDLYISMTKHSFTCSTILILFGIRLLTTDPRSFVDGSRAKDTFVGKDCKLKFECKKKSRKVAEVLLVGEVEPAKCKLIAFQVYATSKL